MENLPKLQDQIWYCYMDSPVGILKISENEEGICSVAFSAQKAEEHSENSRYLHEAKKQLKEYFAMIRKDFDLPLSLKGTEFQLQVWNALKTIPYGSAVSYQDVACMIGRPKASRAVGMANNRNPLVIIIPCHRVIGKDGSLTGYGGGVEKKKILLDLERKNR